jgi:hypothetical protein
MATRRRKITARYPELQGIPSGDVDKIAKSFAAMALMTAEESGFGYKNTRDGRGAPIKASITPAWSFNLAVLVRLSELNGRKAQERAAFLRDHGVWRDTAPPSAGAIKRYRDRWRDQDRVDDVILAAWAEVQAGQKVTLRAVLFP